MSNGSALRTDLSQSGCRPPLQLKHADSLPAEPESPLILVVDDGREILELYQLFFESEGYRVILSAEGSAVSALIESARPDVVILDLLLPDLSGERVLEAIRSDPATASLPVIICSGASRELELKEASLRNLGCTIVLKPFDLGELLGAVERVQPAAR